MAKKNSYITVTDQFCGAGGNSQGVRKVAQKQGGGLEVKLALNHWKLAIETHNTNFPDTIHDCTDISACDPRRYPSTDILITSPECTNHSLAKGVKFNPDKIDGAAERSRATMWDVCRFAEYHSYNAIIMENVVDARKWIMFESWLFAMSALGYNHKCVYLNSMHCHPTPQSRDRMYVVFWKDGNKAPDLDYRPLAYCPECGNDVNAVQRWKNPLKKFGKYRRQYVYCCPVHGKVVEPYYYAAFNCIDWSNIGTRIGDRAKPLSQNTIKRIQFGLKKYGRDPYIIHSAYGEQARGGVVRPITDPLFTQTTFKSQAVINPFIVNDLHRAGIDFKVRSMKDRVDTITTTPHLKLVTPFPWIIEMNRTGECKPAGSPTSTITAGGINHALPIDAWNSFISSYYSTGYSVNGINEVIGTVPTKDRHSIINFKELVLEDCYYRMLTPHEIKLAMAFDKDYTVLGSGRDQIKQLGNAVTPPAMEWLIQQVIETFK